MNFKTRLNELLEFEGISANSLCNELKINHTSMYLFLQGNYPSVKNAVKLANYFNCSLNYLMGLSDNPNSYEYFETYNSSLFFTRYNELLTNNETTHYKVKQKLKFGNSAYQKWQIGSEPKIDTLIKIAKHFDCSIDYLIGRSNDIGCI